MKTIMSIMFASLALSTTAQAQPQFQAGDIAEGQTHFISKSGSAASYYKDGLSGAVTFICTLGGDGVAATLFAGKNFVGNPPSLLVAGTNGPYTWNLHSLGTNTGNIKVKLIKGENGWVQCRQV